MTTIQPGSLNKPEDAARKPDEARVAFWLAQREMADEEEKGWREAAERAVSRFRDEDMVSKGSIKGRKPGSKFNILRANVRVLGGAIYQSQPKPDIRRRFATKDPIGKSVSEVLERSCTYMMDEYDFHGCMKLAVHSMLVPGRGVTRVRYEPEIVEQGEAGESGEAGETGTEPREALAWQKVRCEHVQWRDFRRGSGRTWDEVTWISFDHYLTEAQVQSAFPGIDLTKFEPVECENSFSEDRKKATAVKDALKRYHVIEVWDKTERKIWWISKQYEKPLKIEPDPLELKDFWSIPRPLYALDQDDTLVPVEDFRAYADQADELDKITGRISKIISAIKVRGIYDSTVTALANLLKSGDDNEMIPAQNSTPVMQAGGFDKAIWLLPVDMLAKVLDSLYTQRDQIKQTIYEITGISDIIRGSTDPDETLGAQQLKAQSGSVSISERQENVARYARDLVRIMSEIVAQEFEPQVLQAMTGVELPTAEEKAQAQQAMRAPGPDGQPAEPDPEAVEYLSKPTWDEVMQILKSDQMRSYRVGIETDSTIAGDAQKDQQNVTDLLEATGGYVSAVLPAVQAGMIEVDAAKALLMSVLRRFKLGREVEDAMGAISESVGNAPGGLNPQQAQALQQQVQDQGAQMQQAAQELQVKEQELTQREHAVQQAEAQLQKDVKAAQQVLDAEARAKQAEGQLAVKDAQLQGAATAANAKAPTMHYGADGSVTQIVDQGEAIKALAEMVGQMAMAIQQQAQTQAAALSAGQQQMQQLAAIMAADTEAVRGPNGELIGSRKVIQ